jgi:hypothetical protein
MPGHSTNLSACPTRLLLLEPFVEVVLLRKQVSLDLGILEQLKVALCTSVSSERDIPYFNALQSLNPPQSLIHQRGRQESRYCMHCRSPYLAEARTSPGG